jgi:hypothetical protein
VTKATGKAAAAQSFKALRAAAKPAERSVRICFRPDLRARLQELERDLAAAERERLSAESLDAGARTAELAEQIEAVRTEMQAASRTFVLRRLPRPRFRELLTEHPPGEDAAEGTEVDPETFYPALVRECTVEPELDDDDWAWLLGPDQLSDAEYEELAGAAWLVNARDAGVPFSRLGSRVRARSASESRQPSD